MALCACELALMIESSRLTAANALLFVIPFFSAFSLLALYALHSYRSFRYLPWYHKPTRNLDQSAYVRFLLYGQGPATSVPTQSATLGRIIDRLSKADAPRNRQELILLPGRLYVLISMSVAVSSQLFLFGWAVSTELAPWVEKTLSGGRCCGWDSCSQIANEGEYISFSSSFVDIDGSCSGTHGYIGAALLYCLVFSALAALLVVWLNLYFFCRAYRRDKAMTLRGEWLALTPCRPPSPDFAITATLGFAAVQAVFTSFGWVILTVLFILLSAFICFTIVLPILKIYDDIFWWPIFKWLIWNDDGLGFITAYYLITLASFLVVICFFAVAKNSRAYRNQTMLNNLDLFSTVINLFLGPWTAFRRIVFNLIFSILFLARSDRSLVPRGYEGYDPAFSCYLSFLTIDAYYNNPILSTFVHLLCAKTAPAPFPATCACACICIQDRSTAILRNETTTDMQEIERLRARAKWFVACTLIRNPQLQKLRKNALAEKEAAQRKGNDVQSSSDDAGEDGLSSEFSIPLLVQAPRTYTSGNTSQWGSARVVTSQPLVSLHEVSTTLSRSQEELLEDFELDSQIRLRVADQDPRF
eukprot:m.19885 g.19885  ORF g.19885 m.19885 type:complete len:587 (+) comp31433_c0_seq1:72-1832(+)